MEALWWVLKKRLLMWWVFKPDADWCSFPFKSTTSSQPYVIFLISGVWRSNIRITRRMNWRRRSKGREGWRDEWGGRRVGGEKRGKISENGKGEEGSPSDHKTWRCNALPCTVHLAIQRRRRVKCEGMRESARQGNRFNQFHKKKKNHGKRMNWTN